MRGRGRDRSRGRHGRGRGGDGGHEREPGWKENGDRRNLFHEIDLEIMPTLSVREGRPVVVTGEGEYEPLEDEDGEALTPKEFVEELVKVYGTVLHLSDITGMETNEPQYDLIKDLSGLCELWVDSGSGSVDALIDLFIAGAERAVLSTKGMAGFEDMEEAVEVSDRIAFCIDYNDGVLARSAMVSGMSMAGLVQAVLDRGIEDIILADHGRGKGEDFPRRVLNDMVGRGGRIFVGGNVTAEDLPMLEGMGVDGALLNMMWIIENW